MAKKKRGRSPSIVPGERIERKILLIRDVKVMLDSDLAELYKVETGALVRQVKRNSERFPDDFMFQLSQEEWDALKCQIGIANTGRGGRRTAPYVFTEHGVAMLSSVLRSQRAVDVNIQIMRAFSKLREMLATHKDLARKIAAMEKKYDQQFQVVFDAIRKLLEPPPAKTKRQIGFIIHPDDDE